MEYFVQQLVNGLTLGSIYGLIAIGYTMVYGIVGMINFAHGDIFMVGAFIALIVFLFLMSIFATIHVVLFLLIMMIVAILIVGILMIKVVPQLTFQLKSQGKTLPWNTKLIARGYGQDHSLVVPRHSQARRSRAGNAQDQPDPHCCGRFRGRVPAGCGPDCFGEPRRGDIAASRADRVESCIESLEQK